jgi:hypothetical protein
MYLTKDIQSHATFTLIIAGMDVHDGSARFPTRQRLGNNLIRTLG